MVENCLTYKYFKGTCSDFSYVVFYFTLRSIVQTVLFHFEQNCSSGCNRKNMYSGILSVVTSIFQKSAALLFILSKWNMGPKFHWSSQNYELSSDTKNVHFRGVKGDDFWTFKPRLTIKGGRVSFPNKSWFHQQPQSSDLGNMRSFNLILCGCIWEFFCDIFYELFSIVWA